METVSIKFEEEFLKDIELAMKKHKYSTKAEFIREAIRKLLQDLEKKEYLMRALKLYGAEKSKTVTSTMLHKARQKAAEEIAEELGVSLK